MNRPAARAAAVNECGYSVLVEEGRVAENTEDVTIFFSVVRVAAGHVSQAGGLRRAATLAA